MLAGLGAQSPFLCAALRTLAVLGLGVVTSPAPLCLFPALGLMTWLSPAPPVVGDEAVLWDEGALRALAASLQAQVCCTGCTGMVAVGCGCIMGWGWGWL